MLLHQNLVSGKLPDNCPIRKIETSLPEFQYGGDSNVAHLHWTKTHCVATEPVSKWPIEWSVALILEVRPHPGNELNTRKLTCSRLFLKRRIQFIETVWSGEEIVVPENCFGVWVKSIRQFQGIVRGLERV